MGMERVRMIYPRGVFVIFVPIYRIVHDVFTNPVQGILITDNMIVIIAMPNSRAGCVKDLIDFF